MNQDAYDLFGKCHRLYIGGVRSAIRQRLTEQFGDEWWEQGVLTSLWGAVREQIEGEVEKSDAESRQLLLDSRHFGYIIRKHHGLVFSTAFPNSLRAFGQFRQLTTVRNEWAHVQEISLGRFHQSSNMMQDILAALNCEEALQVEKVRAETLTEPTSNAAKELIEEADLESQPIETRHVLVEPVDSWRQLQSYLRVELTVDAEPLAEMAASGISPGNGTMGPRKRLANMIATRNQAATSRAKIAVRFENTAPDSPDWPRVVFKNVQLRRQLPQDSPISDPIPELGPGETKVVAFEVSTVNLIDLDLAVMTEIDGDELLRFRAPASLPDAAIEGIRREFASQIEAIGFKALVTQAVNTLENVNDELNMRQMSEARKALQEFSGKVDEGVSNLDAVFRFYRLNKEVGIGVRLRELRVAIDKFKSTVEEFDQAIGETDPDKLKEVQASLKDAQLAVLRVESELRSVESS